MSRKEIVFYIGLAVVAVGLFISGYLLLTNDPHESDGLVTLPIQEDAFDDGSIHIACTYRGTKGFDGKTRPKPGWILVRRCVVSKSVPVEPMPEVHLKG